MEYEKEQPGTIKTYLGAVLHCFNYIVITEIKENLTLIKSERRKL